MGDWNAGLLGCFSNCSLCCFANILAPLTVGTIADVEIGAKQPVLWAMATAVPVCALALLRTRVRQKHGIAGSHTMDCCTTIFCSPCVLTQLALQNPEVCDTILPNEQDMNRVANDQSS